MLEVILKISELFLGDVLKALNLKLKDMAFVAEWKKTAYQALEGVSDAQKERIITQLFEAIKKNPPPVDLLARHYTEPEKVADWLLAKTALSEAEKACPRALLTSFFNDLKKQPVFDAKIEPYFKGMVLRGIARIDDKLDALTALEKGTPEPPAPKHIHSSITKEAEYYDAFGDCATLYDKLWQDGQAGASIAIGQVVAGMGGVGKSMLARRYAVTYGDAYAGLWWLEAEKEEGIRGGLFVLAEKLFGPPPPNSDPEARAFQALEHIGASQRPWLLIYDNLEDKALYRKWRALGSSHVLITSRQENWGTLAEELRLACWSDEKGAEYLKERGVVGEVGALEALSQDLGGLPLALSHAAAYLKGHPLEGIERYRALLAERLKAYPATDDYPHSVYATFVIAIESLQSQGEDRQAITFLILFAQMGPEPVAIELIRSLLTFSKLEEEAFDALDQASLVMVEGGQVRMHRLVTLVTQERFADQCASAQEALLHWLAGLIKDQAPQHPDNRSFYEQITALVQHLKEAKPQNKASQGALFLVRNCFAIYLQFLVGNYPEAGGLYEQNLTLAEGSLSEDLPTALNNLAGLYKAQGDYIRALPLYKRALAILEKTLGPEHPSVATALNNLAELYRAQGDYARALSLFERALAIREKALGPEHPNVATTLNNLAGLYEAQGDYARALPLYERALAIDEKALGPEHPNVATTLNNLAGLYRDQGDDAKALPLYERALAIFEKALGPEHPDVAATLNNLALLYHAQRDYASALPYSERAVTILRARLPKEHPHLKTVEQNYAHLVEIMGKT